MFLYSVYSVFLAFLFSRKIYIWSTATWGRFLLSVLRALRRVFLCLYIILSRKIYIYTYLEQGPVLWFSPEDQTPNAAGFVRAPQRPDDRKFGSSRVLQINLPPPVLSIGSRRPDHRPRQSVAFWFSRAPRRGSLQRTSHATPIFGRVRPLTLKAAQPSPARGWPRDHAAAQSLARTPLARQQPALALPPPTP